MQLYILVSLYYYIAIYYYSFCCAWFLPVEQDGFDQSDHVPTCVVTRAHTCHVDQLCVERKVSNISDWAEELVKVFLKYILCRL